MVEIQDEYITCLDSAWLLTNYVSMFLSFPEMIDLLLNEFCPGYFKVFITTTYDATTHFQTTCKEIVDIFKRCTGEDLDLSSVREDLEAAQRE